MYAVVKAGGKQEKLELGEILGVEKLDAEVGSRHDLPVLFVSDGATALVGKSAAGAFVTVEVVGHGKADKVVVFKFKKRKGYKRTRGHRQQLTLIRVTEIVMPGGKKVSGKKAGKGVARQAPVREEEAPPEKARAKGRAPAKRVAAPARTSKTATVGAPAKEPVAKKAPSKEPAAKKTTPKKAAVKAPTKKSAPKKPAARKSEKPAE